MASSMVSAWEQEKYMLCPQQTSSWLNRQMNKWQTCIQRRTGPKISSCTSQHGVSWSLWGSLCLSGIIQDHFHTQALTTL